MESAKASALFQEWRELEARIVADQLRVVKIKAELAGVLGFSPSTVVDDEPDEPVDVDPSEVEEIPSTIAPGTKGRATLDAIKVLGGRARAAEVKDYLVKNGIMEDSANAEKLVRSHFNYLGNRKGYLAKVRNHRGLWKLTDEAIKVIGVP